MPRFSDALFQGLMTPVVDFSKLQEPLGMLMGGAQAERAAQKGQLQALRGAVGAKNAEELAARLAGINDPRAYSAALAGYDAMSTARSRDAEAKAKQDSLKALANRRAALFSQLSDPNSRLSTILGNARYSLLSAAETADPEDFDKALASALKDRTPVSPELISSLEALNPVEYGPAVAPLLASLRGGFASKGDITKAQNLLGRAASVAARAARPGSKASPAVIARLREVGTPAATAIADTLEDSPSPTANAAALNFLREQDTQKELAGIDFNSVESLDAAIRSGAVKSLDNLRFVQDRLSTLITGSRLDYDRIQKALETQLGDEASKEAVSALHDIKQASAYIDRGDDDGAMAAAQFVINSKFIDIFGTDARAISEFDRLSKSKDLFRRVSDSIKEWASGTVTEDTLSDMREFLFIAERVKQQDLLDAATKIEQAGDPKTAKQIRVLYGPRATKKPAGN